MPTVHVTASTEYDVLISGGLLAYVGKLTADAVKPCRVMIVSDETVNALYGEAAAQSYRAAGFSVERFTFQPGEGGKSWDTLGRLVNAMANTRLGRSDIVAALGGGVAGDLGGFAASIYNRGIRYVQIPTTLLAAVDSSVGGKTAVNLNAGKNLAGTFWQPSLVVCDTDILRALPDGIMSDGAAEVVKYGVLSDPEMFGMLAAGELGSNIEYAVTRSVSIKRALVGEDERDTGARQLLNLGHTIGHAIEKLSGFAVPHGRAVAEGMRMMARASERMGYAQPGLAGRVGAALDACGLVSRFSHAADDLAAAALTDKKRRGGTIMIVVPRGIGDCILTDIPVESFRDWIIAGEE